MSQQSVYQSVNLYGLQQELFFHFLMEDVNIWLDDCLLFVDYEGFRSSIYLRVKVKYTIACNTNLSYNFLMFAQ